jgi:hypothetical protein
MGRGVGTHLVSGSAFISQNFAIVCRARCRKKIVGRRQGAPSSRSTQLSQGLPACGDARPCRVLSYQSNPYSWEHGARLDMVGLEGC